MKANEKMPTEDSNDFRYTLESQLEVWKDELKPCEISESEFEKVVKHLNVHFGVVYSGKSNNNPIEVTDIITIGRGPLSGILYFKQPKQVEEIEAVAGYVAFNVNGIISGIYSNLEWLKEDYPKSGYYKLTTLRNI